MKRNLLKFVVAMAICFAVHVLVALFSSIIVNHFILNTRLANFTIYDGYSDFSILLVYIPLSALLVFNKIKGNVLLITTASFAVLLASKVFVFDMISHYIRFYVKTQQNGSYSFEVFEDLIVKQWQSLLYEFGNFGQFLSTIIWVFIALLCICYLSIWAKAKLIKNRKSVPVFGLLLIIGFSSCNDNVQREKDKYPEIPTFPLFKDGKIALKKLDVATVSYKNYQSAKVDGHNLVIHTQDYFYYAVADSSLFLIIGHREAIKPGNPFPAKNFVQLIKLKGSQVLKLNWAETCDNDLPIFNDGKTLIVGSRIFDANAKQLSFTKVDENADDLVSKSITAYTWDFTNYVTDFESKDIFDSTFVKEVDRVTIGSKGKLSGGLNNGINYVYDPVPLVYYQFKVGNKIGLTKINFDEEKPPLLLKVANHVYCVTYSSELKLKYEVKHYQIGSLE